MTDKQLAKLPKWAQQEFSTLTYQLKVAEAKIKEKGVLATRDCDHGIVIDHYGPYPSHFDLKNTVRMWVEPTKFALDFHVESRPGGKPYVRVVGIGRFSSGCISVRPNSGNVIEITGDPTR